MLLERKDKNSGEYSERVLEAETAMEYGIPFDESWYTIPLPSRTVMVAGRMGRMWIDTLGKEEAMEKMHA